MKLHTTISGELRFEIWRSDQLDESGNPLAGESAKLDTGFNKQIITDSFFNAYVGNNDGLSRSDFMQYMGCGTGTGAASASDTAITSQIGTRIPVDLGTLSVVITDSATGAMLETVQYRGTAGQVVGTISEVGLFQLDTGGSTMMRSLIKDPDGDPTTITLGSSDHLYISWRVSTVVPLSTFSSTIEIGGINYNYTIKPCNWSAGGGFFQSINPFCFWANCDPKYGFGFRDFLAFSTQTLGAYTAQPAGSPTMVPHVEDAPIMGLSTYVPGSFARIATYSVAADQCNISGGIGSIVMGADTSVGFPGYQISFSAVSGSGKIPKTSANTLAISMIYSFGRT
jgi:hypothetical protein